MAQLGERLRELRLRAGLSASEAGKRANVSRTMWADYEAGRRPNPTISTVAAMASALGVTLVELLEGVEVDTNL
ncbi:MAG: helix-turn-helix transcriptional regulator [Myxococcales bacterium]|nr:helix-turn-helix transcriptional regulator [Myxococcales bacterium]